jgi:protein gp37
MNATKIEYLNFTWSPLCGCSGKDCAVVAKCWAKYQAKRRLHKCQDCYDFKPHTHFERLRQPLQVKSSKRIGVCFSADMWDSGFNSFDRETVMHYAALAPQHWFINLTKQPQNIPEWQLFPGNWIQGVSVCTRKDLWKIDTLRLTSAKTKVISFEPLYEDLGEIDLTNIDWIIIGAQTHPLLSPATDWVSTLAANASGIPVFIKNNIKILNFLKEYPAKMMC